MPMIPIAPDILDAVMAQLRANESTFEQERARLHVDADRLRHQLKSRFSDYEVVMRTHKKHSKQAFTIEPKPGQPAKPVKGLVRRRGFVDRRAEARVAEERRRRMDDVDGHKLPRVRTKDEMSAEELATLQATAERMLNGHTGLNLRPFREDAMEGS
jgi:hypothetical protein